MILPRFRGAVFFIVSSVLTILFRYEKNPPRHLLSGNDDRTRPKEKVSSAANTNSTQS